jgi:hypothetical protein
MNQKNNMEPRELKRKNYTVQIGYSKKASDKKLLKFIPKDLRGFEISAEDLSSMLIGGVNSETLEATFVYSDKINVVEVGRQLECVLDKDMKQGDRIRLNYTHPYPLEFALIEQAYGIAKVNMDVPVFELTKEYIKKIRTMIKPQQETFLQKFYSSFKNIKIGKK